MTVETQKTPLQEDWEYWSKLKKEGKTKSERFEFDDDLLEERRDGAE